MISLIGRELIYDFLFWIENERKCSVSTRNQRLAAIHAFFRFVQTEAPQMLLQCQKILGIPFKKTGRDTLSYLSAEALKAILRQPDRNISSGRRDLVLLTVLYDTGARVQEIIDMVVKDIRLENPPIISLTGKGNKTRHVPVMSKTAKILSDYLIERRLNTAAMHNHPVFYNSQHKMLTRAGVTYIINKYVNAAGMLEGIVLPGRVTPICLDIQKPCIFCRQMSILCTSATFLAM